MRLRCAILGVFGTEMEKSSRNGPLSDRLRSTRSTFAHHKLAWKLHLWCIY